MYYGAEGATPREKINTMRREQYAARKSSGSAVASTAFLNKGDKLYEYSQNITPIQGFEDIVVHGDTRGFAFKDADGKESDVSPKEFAQILKESNLYNGGDIRLIACEAGKKGATAAQALADELGVRIMAPSDTVYVYPDGAMMVSSDGLTEDGKWVMFEPK